MPAGLLDLRFHNNMVSAIPALPTGLTKLACQNNQIDCLPVLPQTLTLLDCYCNNLACLPNMPPGIPAYLNAYPNPWFRANTLFPFRPLLPLRSDRRKDLS